MFNIRKLSPTSISTNFIIGMAHAFDIGASLKKAPWYPASTDIDNLSLHYDWHKIGDDMRSTFDTKKLI